MDTPDDCRRIADDPPECPACGQEMERMGPRYYVRTCPCTDEQVEAAEADDDD